MSEKCAELLEQWEQARWIGWDLNAEDLAHDQPAEVLEELRECIRLLRRSQKRNEPKP